MTHAANRATPVLIEAVAGRPEGEGGDGLTGSWRRPNVAAFCANE